MTAETTDRSAALAKLREKFPDENIAKLPKVNCYNCTQANKAQRNTTCGSHRMAKCAECGNYITTGHIHLDYVGHAETTDRLLDADPEWTWEPLAFDDRGLPAVDGFGGLWIRLTIAGVTRLGYGSADGKPGPNGVKEAIGDAIRNAAMRFGVALDLWAKTDLHSDEHDSGPGPEAAPERPARRESGKTDDEWTAQRERGRSDDDWSNAGPAMATPQQVDYLNEGLRVVRGAESTEARATALSQILGRQVGADERLTLADAERVRAALAEEDQQNAKMQQQVAAKPEPATGAQLTLLNTLTTGRGLADRNARLAFLAGFVKRPLTSSKDLTKAEASSIIDRLNADQPSPDALSVREILARRIRNAATSSDLADASEAVWKAAEAGDITQEQASGLIDVSMARETELAQMVGSAS